MLPLCGEGVVMKLSIITLSICFMCTQAYAVENQPIQTTGTQMQTTITAEKNKMEGLQFLETNKTKPGVVTLPDGLQYKEIVKGEGATPTKNDTVTVHYAGTLTNGTEFDSSYKRGTPASFPVSGVIPGWTEALQLMKVGSTWELYIPSTLAYGTRGAPPVIGPNEVLIFKVQLLSIKKS